MNLVVDTLYFGQRLEKTDWSATVFRDPNRKENLWWGFGDGECTSIYLKGREELEKLGYELLSVTGDGFSGIRQAFSGILFQMCHVHMERIVVRGTTHNPLIEAGHVLLALIKTLPYTDEKTFKERFNKYIEKYRDFLNEKTINPLTGRRDYTHRELRTATTSVYSFLPYLFTFTLNKNIPSTTNSIEGHFSHIRDIVDVHRGLSKESKEKVLGSIFLASTIAPTQGKLSHIL